MHLRLSMAVLAILSPASAQAPPRMFTSSYTEALRDILQLEESDVAQLERQLSANPEDLQARLKLMAYEARADRTNHPEDRAKRIRHTVWLIEHHPQSEILHSYVSHFSTADLPVADFQRAMVLWHTASRAKPADAAIQWNAASFFQGLDQNLYLHTAVRL